MIRPKILSCSTCLEVIGPGQRFTAQLVLPTKARMPVGRLDTALTIDAERITCAGCSGAAGAQVRD